MDVPLNLVYLVATIPLVAIWLVLFAVRKDIRKEMVVMSVLIGILSVATSYYWWTTDWWLPPTLTGTKVGIEDFIMGFATGGIMAVIYEVVFKKRFYRRKLHHHVIGGFTILLLLAQTTSWFVWGAGLTTFWASAIAMIIISAVMLYMRRDLFKNAVGSGVLMLLSCLPFYAVIVLFSPQWLNVTYLSSLSGARVSGVPVEEFAFWFLAGFLWGPFYEYWQGERLRKMNY
jgi:hypothetical protein